MTPSFRGERTKDADAEGNVSCVSDRSADRRIECDQPMINVGVARSEIDPDARISRKQERISYEIHTRNETLEDDRHPITGVPFRRRTVEDADGNEVTGVFPEFESAFDAKLPNDLLQATDREQFAECNRQLKDALTREPKLIPGLTSEQLEQIADGETPDGYTWHHNEEVGRMQFVNADIHAQTGHTGGKTVWGGGSENR